MPGVCPAVFLQRFSFLAFVFTDQAHTHRHFGSFWYQAVGYESKLMDMLPQVGRSVTEPETLWTSW